MLKQTGRIVLLILLATIQVCWGDEGYFSQCSILSYSLSYDDSSQRICLPCSGDAQSLYLNMIDPESLVAEKVYQFDGLINAVCSFNNRQNLLIALSELDGNSSTEEGVLKEIDYATGNTLRSLYLDKSPRAMVINSDETFAFIALGIHNYDEIRPKLIKVSLSSFLIVDEVNFGHNVTDMEIIPNGEKLYVNTDNLYSEHPSLSLWGVGVFDTSNMKLIKRLQLWTVPGLMDLSADGSRLFVASHNYAQTSGSGDLYIIDTYTDEEINNLQFFYNGMEVGTTCPVYSAVNNKLYCSTAPKTDYAFRYSNLILELDLSDYSYSFFEMGNNPLIRIALAEMPCLSRLFAKEESTAIIHYKDVSPPNQPPTCALCTLTPMPYYGSSPASIEFMAEASDPDNDEITYHWDFDGDLIFDEPSDDSYTGDPYNPTHEYTQDGTHVVTLKVSDQCEGESFCTIPVEIEFE